MNLRRKTLTVTFLGTLFINCASQVWTMWSVLTISLFMLLITDFMFFAVRALARHRPPRPFPRCGAPGCCPSAVHPSTRSLSSLTPPPSPRQDNEFW